MAVHAARAALDSARTNAEEIDLLIVGTVTPDMQFPSTAVLVQAKLGAKNAVAFDLSAACAGSLFALSIADQYIRSGAAKRVLVIGAELLTRIADWTDRATCVLFGDAAGAMVLGPEPRDDRGLLSIHLHSDGTQAGILCMPGGGSARPFSQSVLDAREAFIHMNGREVYRFAVRALEAVCREALSANDLSANDLDHVIAHQANLRILEAVMKRLEIPLEKCHLNIEQVGNTSSASLPLTLDEAHRAGKLRDGDRILMMAIGGGMTWGSGLLRWSV